MISAFLDQSKCEKEAWFAVATLQANLSSFEKLLGLGESFDRTGDSDTTRVVVHHV